VLPDPELAIESDFAVGGGHASAGALLDLPSPPTAIFAFNDQLAIGAMRAALERDLRVPEDLSIVGFDDTATAELVTPALTTVRQPLAEMGRMAVSLLIRLLENRSVEALHVELETQLIVRGSTAAPAGEQSALITSARGQGDART
jgi:LacI family transcriptional regulator